MCGRYALALRPAQVRQMLQEDNMPVDDAPPDGGDDAPRQSYNFAPSYHGVVYRADAPAATRQMRLTKQRLHQDRNGAEAIEDEYRPKYKLQTMQWGLIPSWTKQKPGYANMMKTINCRDDSLSPQATAMGVGHMWNSMKAKKRCVVIAQGFYEWMKKGPGGKEKVPYYVKRKDGRLMLFAGLWDRVQFENSESLLYTYTIITTSSNSRLHFLHDRMPVILEPDSDALRTWLDPTNDSWSHTLAGILKPYEGELDVYPVSQDVGKVGNNSPNFVVPVDSQENKRNIANFFANAATKEKGEAGGKDQERLTRPYATGADVKQEDGKSGSKPISFSPMREDGTIQEEVQGEMKAEIKSPLSSGCAEIKREAPEDVEFDNLASSSKRQQQSSIKEPISGPSLKKSTSKATEGNDDTSSKAKSPAKAKKGNQIGVGNGEAARGTRKITSYFTHQDT